LRETQTGDKKFMEERRNIPRREFVDRYFPHLVNIVKRVGKPNTPNIEFNDLLNSAVIGLLKCVDRYDPDKGEFFTFAYGRIKGEIIDCLRSNDEFKRSSRALVKKYEATYNEMANENPDFIPEFDDVVDRLELDDRQRKALAILLTPEDSMRQHIKSFVKDPEEIIDKLNDQQILQAKLPDAIKELSEKQRYVLDNYYFHEKTLKSIANELGLTESRISQIRKEAIANLQIKLKTIKVIF
jgi:RNA polymerase sigma factor for flagellar operon FliA